MRDSIARKVPDRHIVGGSAGRPGISFVADARVRPLAVAVGLAAIGLAWFLAQSLGRRITR